MSLNPFDSPVDRRRSRLETTRRQFLGIMGTFASLGALIFGGFMSLKFMFPNATFEDPPQFKVDDLDPTSLKSGSVHSRTDKRVTVVRDDGGFYAVYLVCTHLGCTPNYFSDVASDISPSVEDRAKKRGVRSGADQVPNGWKCPCHGSRYFIDSTNFYGPAPRPMDWVEVSKAPDGKLLVDRSKIVVFRQPADTTPPGWRLDYESGKVVTVPGSKLVKS